MRNYAMPEETHDKIVDLIKERRDTVVRKRHTLSGHQRVAELDRLNDLLDWLDTPVCDDSPELEVCLKALHRIANNGTDWDLDNGAPWLNIALDALAELRSVRPKTFRPA